jgi:GAF domain-containing protein
MYSTPVATAEELVAAIEAGENVILTQDLDIDAVAMTKAAHSGLVLASDIEIDGNGHSISTTAVRAILVDGAKKVTIKNLTLNAPQSERGFQLQGEGETLVLGPFQGKPACIEIPLGRGVCGTAVAEKKTQLVPDVHAFPGHIACDSASNSEIVVPLFDKEGNVVGVLDVDSPIISRFDENDKNGLEAFAEIVEKEIF